MAHGKDRGRRRRNRNATAARKPASTRFHSSSDPSSADHSARTLKNVGVARLEFSATYRTEKSFARIAASIVTFATSTSATSENAEVRALSTMRALRLRAPTKETAAP